MKITPLFFRLRYDIMGKMNCVERYTKSEFKGDNKNECKRN